MSSAPTPPSFGGEITELYQNLFVQNKPSWDAVAGAVVARIPSPDGRGVSILDIATGPGEPACTLQSLLPRAAVTASDSEPDMIQAARKRAAAQQLDSLRFAVLDCADLTSVSPRSIDFCTINYGLMFLEDLPHGLNQVARILKTPEKTGQSGYLIATVWEDLKLMETCRAAMKAVLKKDPPTPQLNPMSLSKPESIDIPLKEAGFQIEESMTAQYTFKLGSDAETAWRIGTLPIQQKLMELHEEGQHGDVMGIARSAFEAYTKPWQKGGEVVMPASTFRLIVAKLKR